VTRWSVTTAARLLESRTAGCGLHGGIRQRRGEARQGGAEQTPPVTAKALALSWGGVQSGAAVALMRRVKMERLETLVQGLSGLHGSGMVRRPVSSVVLEGLLGASEGLARVPCSVSMLRRAAVAATR
jgi:hypothetical protein